LRCLPRAVGTAGRVEALDAGAVAGVRRLAAVSLGGLRWRRRPVEAPGRDLPASRPAPACTAVDAAGRVEALDAVAQPLAAVAIGGPWWRRRPVKALGRSLPASRRGLHHDRCPGRVEAYDAAREPRLSFAGPPRPGSNCRKC
jgi:hypothetical protein